MIKTYNKKMLIKINNKNSTNIYKINKIISKSKLNLIINNKILIN